MDYPCAKFGDFSFSRFGLIVQTDRITDEITEADDRYTHTTTIGMSNYNSLTFLLLKQHKSYRPDVFQQYIKSDDCT